MTSLLLVGQATSEMRWQMTVPVNDGGRMMLESASPTMRAHWEKIRPGVLLAERVDFSRMKFYQVLHAHHPNERNMAACCRDWRWINMTNGKPDLERTISEGNYVRSTTGSGCHEPGFQAYAYYWNYEVLHIITDRKTIKSFGFSVDMMGPSNGLIDGLQLIVPDLIIPNNPVVLCSNCRREPDLCYCNSGKAGQYFPENDEYYDDEDDEDWCFDCDRSVEDCTCDPVF